MPEAVAALRFGEAVEQVTTNRPQRVDCSGCCALQEPLELRKDEFDWARLRTVRRQVNEPRTRGRNRFLNACDLVSTEVVRDLPPLNSTTF